MSKSKSENKKMWRSQVWWVPIVVAVIGLIGVIFPRVLEDNNQSSAPTSQTFDYPVRVQEKDSSKVVSNAKIILEVAGKAPLDEITDSNGFARIRIESSHVGKPGRLIVEATGYEKYIQNIDLAEDTLPDIIQLEPQ